jgi:sortase A
VPKLAPLAARLVAAGLALAGAAVLAWIAVTLVWGDPISAVVTSRAQAGLRRELGHERAAWAERFDAAATLRRRATLFGRGLAEGDAVGELVIPRLRLRMVVVEGTAERDLERGPGHYRITSLPGRGGTIAIAGHRTTYLAPLRHIDALRPGNSLYLLMPYGAFRYVVYSTAVVDANDWSIIRRRSFEELVLSSCHPLYSASHRIVVFGRLRSSSLQIAPAKQTGAARARIGKRQGLRARS